MVLLFDFIVYVEYVELSKIFLMLPWYVLQNYINKEKFEK